MSVTFEVRPGTRPLRGALAVPPDVGVVARWALVAGLAEGVSSIGALTPRDPTAAVVDALRMLGVDASYALGGGPLRVVGSGLDGLSPPRGPIACGDEVELAHLLAGVLSGQRFASRIELSDAVEGARFGATADALRRRGATIEGHFSGPVGEIVAPLDVGPALSGVPLSPLEVALPQASPATKGALLLSGLYADGVTVVQEPLISADHTERLLAAVGAPVEAVGTMVALDTSDWSRRIESFEARPPGDLGAALALAVAAFAVPGSSLVVRGVGSNPTRVGVFEHLRDADAPVALEDRGASLGEPTSDLHVVHGAVRARALGGERALRARGELPMVCAVMALSHGVSMLSLDACSPADLGSLALMIEALRRLGVGVEFDGATMHVEGAGGAPLRGADVDAAGDAGVAMALTAIALAASGACKVRGVEGVGRVFPRFAGALRALGADVRVAT